MKLTRPVQVATWQLPCYATFEDRGEWVTKMESDATEVQLLMSWPSGAGQCSRVGCSFKEASSRATRRLPKLSAASIGACDLIGYWGRGA